MQTESGTAHSIVANDLRSLGVREGDDLLVMAATRSLQLPAAQGGTRVSGSQALLQGLLAAVGESGTVLVMSFSGQSWTPTQKWHSELFSNTKSTINGGFSAHVLAQPDAHRSSHPTNSFAAIGAHARDYVEFHGPHAHCFRPVEELISRSGKMLSVGTIEQSPGFSTVHVAQFHLGLSHQSLLGGISTARYYDSFGRNRLFRKWDIPGCSMGFGRLYPHYRAAGVLHEGGVAGSASMLLGAAQGYEIARKALIDDPTCVLCTDPDCMSCRAMLRYNVSDWRPYWQRKIANARSRVRRDR